MDNEKAGGESLDGGSAWANVDFSSLESNSKERELMTEEDKRYLEAYEEFGFDGNAIFTDIDGTLTDNSGKIDERAITFIKKFREAGGTFVPVTGRARFESVKDIVEKLDLPFIVINNGAEIFDREGKRIYGSEIPEEQMNQAFSIAEKNGLIWMQNKKNPATGEEYLYSNFTEESERAMLEAGIVDTVHNEEGRIGLSAKQATVDEVMSIPGQNYKIQMMSPNPDAVQAAYEEFQRLGIPSMLNMESKKTGRFHWVEVIKGTKISGIQWLIDSGLVGDIKSARVVGDGGNDLTMFKDLHNREGEPIINTRTAVKNACDKLKNAADEILNSDFDNYKGERNTDIGQGAAMVEIFEDEAKLKISKLYIEEALRLIQSGSTNVDKELRRVRSFIENRNKAA